MVLEFLTTTIGVLGLSYVLESALVVVGYCAYLVNFEGLCGVWLGFDGY